MGVVPGDHEDDIHVRVVQHGVEIGGRGGEAELALRVGGRERRGGDDLGQRDVRTLLQMRQQHRRRVVARADERQTQRSARAADRLRDDRPRRRRGRGRGDRLRLALGVGRDRSGVAEQHRDSLQLAALELPVGLRGRVEVGDVRDQRLRRPPVPARPGRGSTPGCGARSSGRSRSGSRGRRARIRRRSAPARTSARTGRPAPSRSRRSTAGRAWHLPMSMTRPRSRASLAASSTGSLLLPPAAR